MLAIWVGWVALVLSVASFVIFVLTVVRRPGVAPQAPQAHGAADGARVLEALAKVIDAFSKAGPAVSALIGCFLFLGLAAFMSLHGRAACKCAKDHSSSNSTQPQSSVSRCVVAGFTEGDVEMPKANMLEIPIGCLQVFVTRAGRKLPLLTMIGGRVDRRELRPRAKKRFGTNFTLAYQRAVSLREYLRTRIPASGTDGFAESALLFGAGPEHTEGTPTDVGMELDRSVAVFGIWPTNKDSK
jgi:hypothetical protein